MRFTDFLNQTKAGFVLKHLFFALIVGVVILLLVNAFLYKYTDHGVEVELPCLTGMYVDDAEEMVEDLDIQIVVTDSMHRKDLPAGQIIDQAPKPGMLVKRGSTVYLVINSFAKLMIPVPDVQNMSMRQAKAILENQGFRISRVDTLPSVYKGLVVELRSNGSRLQPGIRLEDGSQVVMCIGSGSTRTSERTRVPNLMGLTLQAAKDTIEAYHLVLGTYDYDEEPSEGEGIVYVVCEQAPLRGKNANEGEPVSLLLTRKDTLGTQNIDTNQDDEFF